MDAGSLRGGIRCLEEECIPCGPVTPSISYQHKSMQYQEYGTQYNNLQSYGGKPQGVIVTQPASGVVPAVPQAQYRDWMIFSILVLIFCFWPTGIPAVIYSKKANNAARFGNWVQASTYARHAKTFVIISLIVGISLIVISIVVRVILTVIFSS